MNFEPQQFDINGEKLLSRRPVLTSAGLTNDVGLWDMLDCGSLFASDNVYESRALDAKISGAIKITDGSGFIVKVKSGAGERDVSVAANGFFSFYEP
ncbi:hypothetical protein GCK32_020067, partial [Trichostrongylus colubriformis]